MSYYLRDPAAIYRRSFEIVRQECDTNHLPEDLAEVVLRLVHACGMTDIIQDLHWTDDVATKARNALKSGAPIIADCQMVAHGIISRRLPAENEVICKLGHLDSEIRATKLNTTRSAAAVDGWIPHLDNAVVAIGNAPTALFRLLEVLADGAPKPAAIFAFPVGFVGASESKNVLISCDINVPFITLMGRRGGSSLAAAAVNAIAGETEDDQ